MMKRLLLLLVLILFLELAHASETADASAGAKVRATSAGPVPCFPESSTMTIQRMIFIGAQSWGMTRIKYAIDYQNQRGREDVELQGGPDLPPMAPPYTVLYVSKLVHTGFIFNDTDCLITGPANVTRWCLDGFSKQPMSRTVGTQKQDVWSWAPSTADMVDEFNLVASDISPHSYAVPTIRNMVSFGNLSIADWYFDQGLVDPSVFEIPKQCVGERLNRSDQVDVAGNLAEMDAGWIKRLW